MINDLDEAVCWRFSVTQTRFFYDNHLQAQVLDQLHCSVNCRCEWLCH